jgi:type IV pilus assembly protein PilQ
MSSMRVLESGRFRKAATLCGAVLLVCGVAACAGTQTTQAPTSSASVETISGIQVDRLGVETVVTLQGVDHPVFTAFAQDDASRVVVDLVSTKVDTSAGHVSVHDGLVREITATPTGMGDATARVEIHLEAAADYEVEPQADGLKITLSPSSDTVAASEPEAGAWGSDDYDPWTAAADDTATPVAAESQSSDTSDPWATTGDDTPAQPVEATHITAVEAESVADGTIVRVMADGLIGNAVTFTLDDPARLVVDLPGLQSDTADSSVDVGSNEASRVRVGQHADKVRIVVDGGSSETPFDGRRVVPAPAGLMIALGRGEAIDHELARATSQQPTSMPVAAAEPEVVETLAMDTAPVVAVEPTPVVEPAADIVPVAEAAPADTSPMLATAMEESPAAVDVTPAQSAVASIYGIEFDSQETRDRIVVLGDGPVDYFVFEPEANTLIVTLQDARIDPEAAVRITPEAPGPVSLVTAFEQPELEVPEVRLVVQRAPNLKPEITRRGSLLIVDFPRTGEIAAAPPVMAPEAAKLAAAQAGAPASVPAVSSIGPDAEPMIDPMGDLANADMPANMEPGASIDILHQGGLTSGKVYSGRRISLDFKDVDIADVLRLIAEVSELNVIAGDEVKGKVTIRLVDVPWDQALDVVLLTKGLGFMRIGNVLRIAPQAVIAQEEEMRLQERRAKEKLEDLVVKLQPVNYADVAEVSGMVGQLLSARGSVNTDKRTNTLIIKDIPSVIDEATALIKAVDTQTPQVLIEAKIVEASLDFSREFGAQWGLGVQPLTDAFDSASPARQDLGGSDLTFHNSENSNFFGNNAVFSNPITANPTGLFNMAAFLLDQKLNLELQLQAAEVNGDGKVISSPRVVTLDNSKASIEQGVSIPFQTFENGDAQLEFVDAVLKLEVTPHITADASIIMKLAVSRNAPDTSVFTLTGSPAIAKNQVKTETLVKDGQTLVLGGIYVIEKSDRQSRVPYLHSIPLIGAAFRSDEHSELRKELLIFVTPRVVQTPGSDV